MLNVYCFHYINKTLGLTLPFKFYMYNSEKKTANKREKKYKYKRSYQLKEAQETLVTIFQNNTGVESK